MIYKQTPHNKVRNKSATEVEICGSEKTAFKAM